jgi:hypothetical protein
MGMPVLLAAVWLATDPTLSMAAPSTPGPSTETPATETPATETPATETPATETPATETPATETPATETPATSTGRLHRRSIAATAWPVEPGLAGGFLFSGPGVIPFAGLTLFVPVIPGLGPVALGRGAHAADAAVSFTEGQLGLGLAWEGRLGELRARAGIVPLVVVTALGDGGADVTSVTPAVLAPLELGLPLGGGVSFGAVVEPGVAPRARVVGQDASEVGRDRFFVNVGASLTFGGPFD